MNCESLFYPNRVIIGGGEEGLLILKIIGKIGLALVIAISATACFAVNPIRAQEKLYTDVPTGDWGESAIYSLSVLDIVSGYPDGSFRPDEPVSREAVIKMMTTAMTMGEQAAQAASMALKDIGQDRWSYGVIAQAYAAGTVDFLIAEEQLYPVRPMTRQEMAASAGKWLLRSLDAGTRQAWLEGGWRSARVQFTDQLTLDEDILPYAYYAIEHGVLQGDQAGTFRPLEPISRKEASAVIVRMLERRSEAHALAVSGFYAIASYPRLPYVAAMDHLITGWSHLSYIGEGEAKLGMTSTEYKVPADGWEEVVATADSFGVPKSLMVFSDSRSLPEFLQDQPAQEQFIEELKLVMDDSRYGYSGVLIDFEGLRLEEQRMPYTEFLKKVKAALTDEVLIVAVPPTQWYQGYDLKEIGLLADTVILMAHDFTHLESGLPSAPLAWVQDATEDALGHIPREKLVLGLSKQANQWVIQEDGTRELLQPSIDRVETRLSQDGIVQRFAYPYFLSLIEYSDGGARHVIWYEDTESIEKKMWLAKVYGLKGISLWHMGNYTEADYEYIESISK